MSISLPVAGRQSSPPQSRTVPQSFDLLLKSLSIEASKPRASKQQQGLRDNLEGRMEVLATILTGSYRRSTQIPPLDDIDVLLVLDPEAYADYFRHTSEKTAGIL